MFIVSAIRIISVPRGCCDSDVRRSFIDSWPEPPQLLSVATCHGLGSETKYLNGSSASFFPKTRSLAVVAVSSDFGFSFLSRET
jgi:hypothetical protein